MTKQSGRHWCQLGLGLWLAAWFLPALQGEESVYGAQCFHMAASMMPQALTDSRAGFLRWGRALSPWTNVLIPLTVLVLHHGSLERLRRWVPWALAAGFLVNLIWLGGIEGVFGLRNLLPGYYLWIASFPLVGAATAQMESSGTGASGSLLLEDAQLRPLARRALTAFSLVVLLIFAFEALLVTQ